MIVIDARTVIVLSLSAAGQGRGKLTPDAPDHLMVMMMDGTAAQALASLSEHAMHDARHALLDGLFGPAEESCRETKDPLHPPPQLRFPCFVSFRFVPFRCLDARQPWCLLSTLIPLQLPILVALLSACSSPPRLSSFPQPTHQALGPFHPVAGTHAHSKPWSEDTLEEGHPLGAESTECGGDRAPSSPGGSILHIGRKDIDSDRRRDSGRR